MTAPPDAVEPSRRRRWITALGVLAVVWVWMAGFYPIRGGVGAEWGQRAAAGFRAQGQLFYMYWHTGHVPLYSEIQDQAPDTPEAAHAIIRDRPETLRTEYDDSSRFGNLSRLWLLFPYAALKDTTRPPSPKIANIILYNLALGGVVFALAFMGRPVLALAFGVLMGSDRFQLYEVYRHSDLFGLSRSCALLALAAHVPLLLTRRPTWKTCVLPAALCGPLLGVAITMRTEFGMAIVSLGLLYLLWPGISRRDRVLSLVVLAASVGLVVSGVRAYFDAQLDRVEQLVRERGGSVYEGQRTTSHPVWHAVHIGLGDYGSERGFHWSDEAAHWRAMPELREHLPPEFAAKLPREKGAAELKRMYHDDAGHYRIYVEEMPEYYDIVRRQVLTAIGDDPLWYAGILARRVVRVFWETSALSVGVWTWHMPLFFNGFAGLLVLAWLVRRRDRFAIAFVLYSLPLATAAVVVYSGRGMTRYHFLHAAALAILLEAGVRWWRARRAGDALTARAVSELP